MHPPPALSAATLEAAVHTHYQLVSTDLTFLPLGNDTSSWVYCLTAVDGANYFLKLRASHAFSPASLLVPRFLCDHGVPNIIPPLPTTSGALWVELDAFSLSLTPFLDVQPAADTGLSDHQWRRLGATLRHIHTTSLPPELQRHVPHETWTPSRRRLLTDLAPVVAAPDHGDAVQRDLSRFWRAHHDDIHAVIARTDMLSAQCRRTALSRVLCHADFHAWNVLLDADGQLWIVDWDETIVAPKERDLMFVMAGIYRHAVSDLATTQFLQGYGAAAIDEQLLTYYRYSWAVQEMGAYAEEVFSLPESDADARHAAAHQFIDLFAPGNIVAIARASDSRLPRP